MKDVLIVGGGIGGLCTAIRLLNKGYKVTILEKKNKVGGKINTKNNNSFNFDLTASIIMTPYIYKEIFEDVGKNYKDYFEMEKLDPIYRVYYYDKTYYDYYSDTDKMIEVLESMQKGLSVEYFNFISSSYEKYFISKKNILDKPMIKISEVLKYKYLKVVNNLRPFSSSYNYLYKKISNKKLRDYILFNAMYIGINPYTNSNLYTSINSISHLHGLSYIKGGLYTYILSLEKLIKELGGNIKTNYNVDKILIKDKKIIGVKSKEEVINSDIVICNADFSYSIENLFEYDIKESRYKRRNLKSKDYSCSVFMIYLGLNKKYDNLKVHNIFINRDFKDSIEDAFKGKIPKNPSLYIYCPSSIDDCMCDNKYTTLNIMLRVPNLSFKNINYDKNQIKKLRDKIIDTIKNIIGLEDIEKHIIYEDYLTPITLKESYNSYYGSAFGLSHKLSQSMYFRPHLKSKNIEGLYFISSSTHPGNGTSVIIDGSKVLCNCIDKDINKK